MNTTKEEHDAVLDWEHYVAVMDRLNGFGSVAEKPLDYELRRMHESARPEFVDRYRDTFCQACGERRKEEHTCME